jgi:hypothetical protein
MDTSQLIAALNSINVGELDGVRVKLNEARQACVALQQEELANKLTEAEGALLQADLGTYRKRLETVIARLGHLR